MLFYNAQQQSEHFLRIAVGNTNIKDLPMADGLLFRLLQVVCQNIHIADPRRLYTELLSQNELSTSLTHHFCGNHLSRQGCASVKLPFLGNNEMLFLQLWSNDESSHVGQQMIFPRPRLLVVLARDKPLDQLGHSVCDVCSDHTSHSQRVQRIDLFSVHLQQPCAMDMSIAPFYLSLTHCMQLKKCPIAICRSGIDAL